MAFPAVLDLVGAVIGAVLTLMVLSYLLGDNPAFRFAIHLFIGVSAGIAGAVVVRNVIIPQVLLPLVDLSDPINWLWTVLLLLLSVLVLMKLSPRYGRVGNVPMAYIVGVGAAVVASGAVLGTIFPQVEAASDLLNFKTTLSDEPLSSLLALINNLIMVVGTLSTLAYFHFSARSQQNAEPKRPAVVEYAAGIGHIFIAVTFGVLFAGVFSAALAAWINRWNFILQLLDSFAAFVIGS